MIGLFELLVVLAIPFAWGVYELRSLRRDRLAREKAADPAATKLPKG